MVSQYIYWLGRKHQHAILRLSHRWALNKILLQWLGQAASKQERRDSVAVSAEPVPCSIDNRLFSINRSVQAEITLLIYALRHATMLSFIRKSHSIGQSRFTSIYLLPHNTTQFVLKQKTFSCKPIQTHFICDLRGWRPYVPRGHWWELGPLVRRAIGRTVRILMFFLSVNMGPYGVKKN